LSSGDARLVAIPVAFGVIADIGQNAEIVAFDPERRFATVNCRIAKGLFDHLVGDGEQP
jgi:hypothetical protein